MSTTKTIQPILLFLLISAPLIAALPGCSSFWPTSKLSAAELNQPHLIVIHVPGIAGIWAHDLDFAKGLRDAGINDVRKFEWTGPIALVNLMDEELHEREAAELASRLRELEREQPNHRIIITAHSGGTRVAALAIEKLGHEAREIVEQVWLIAPALDPAYDLSPLLDDVPRVVAVSSSGDWLILGMGTSTFGTADGYHGDAAGLVGFSTEDPRLDVIRIDGRLERHGAGDDHLGALRRRFAREFVGPAILNWSAESELRTATRQPEHETHDSP